MSVRSTNSNVKTDCNMRGDNELENPLIDQRQKVQEVAGVSFCNLIEGFGRSRILLGLLSATVVALGTVFLVSNPYGWALTLLVKSILIGSIAVGSIGLLSTVLYAKGHEKIKFELGTIKRNLKKQNYDEIRLENLQLIIRDRQIQINLPSKLYLGALLRKNVFSSGGDMDHLKANDIQRVVSINEDWEKRPLGLSVPYTPEEFESQGIEYIPHACEDHGSLDPQDLLVAGMQIADGLEEPNGNTYVHCKAGQGRSAILVAAALMILIQRQADRDIKLTSEDFNQIFEAVEKHIKQCRPGSRLHAKKHYLQPFFEHMISHAGKAAMAPGVHSEAQHVALLPES